MGTTADVETSGEEVNQDVMEEVDRTGTHITLISPRAELSIIVSLVRKDARRI